MEEDIKILEEWIAFKKQFNLYPGELEIISAIENLIKRNKELEEFIIKYYDEIRKEYEGLINHKLIDYIPKSKIKEKIEEYKKKIIEARKEDDDCKELYYEQEIEILQELLGEEK